MYLVSIFLYPPLDVIIPLIGESCKFIRVFLFFFLLFFSNTAIYISLINYSISNTVVTRKRDLDG